MLYRGEFSVYCYLAIDSSWHLKVASSPFSTVAMRVQFKRDEIDYYSLDPLRGLLATTTGLLWLRVLSLLKSINSQLATFVLAIFQITRDITWFLVILCVLVASFAQVKWKRVSA